MRGTAPERVGATAGTTAPIPRPGVLIGLYLGLAYTWAELISGGHTM
ncbi:hypothetical protein [Mycobacterium sp.]